MGVVIGITGGIATGKTTVARMFEDLGAERMDADQVARDVLQPGSDTAKSVIEAFGPTVLAPDGSIDRAELGAVIFADPSAREQLNRITHPPIIRRLRQRIKEFRSRPAGTAALVIEIPLLVEANLTRMVDRVLLVRAEQDEQRNRLRMRGGLTAEQIDQRIGSQMPVCDKTPYADWVVDTGCPLEKTRSQVLRIWKQVQDGIRAL